MNYASGMFWITVLFVSALGVHRSFAYEKEYDAFSMLVTAPIDRGLIFLAKWVSGFIYLTLMEILIIFPFFKFLMIDYPSNILIAISTTLLVNLGIMAVANLVSGIAMRSNLSEILLPILFFPLVSPIIIAATKISTGVMLNESYGVWEIWVLIVGSIIIISGLAGYALFDYLVEE
jgi:heme exporter protein B